jgi:hypothetical protein
VLKINENYNFHTNLFLMCILFIYSLTNNILYYGILQIVTNQSLPGLDQVEHLEFMPEVAIVQDQVVDIMEAHLVAAVDLMGLAVGQVVVGLMEETVDPVHGAIVGAQVAMEEEVLENPDHGKVGPVGLASQSVANLVYVVMFAK